MKEKERILKLLEEGKITAEEAVKLLDALKKSYNQDEVFCVEVHPGHHHPHPRLIKRKIRIPGFVHRFEPFSHYCPMVIKIHE